MKKWESKIREKKYLKSKNDNGIMRAEKRRKSEGERT